MRVNEPVRVAMFVNMSAVVIVAVYNEIVAHRQLAQYCLVHHGYLRSKIDIALFNALSGLVDDYLRRGRYGQSSRYFMWIV
jgi:hypothetical protein